MMRAMSMQRRFSSINLKSEFANLDDVHKLHRLQTSFDNDPTISKNAYELFKVSLECCENLVD
jgi:hypothetical protein